MQGLQESPPLTQRGATDALRLFEETARRREAEQRIVSVLSASFRELSVPLIDPALPYDGIVPDELLRRSYRFTDREGALLLLRSDFTPAIARQLAGEIVRFPLPLRLFYRGEVLRREERRAALGGARFQVGAEIIGGSAEEEDLFLLRTVAQICEQLQLPCKLAVSDASLIDQLLAGAALDADGEQRLSGLLDTKRLDDARDLLALLQPEMAAVVERFVRGRLTVGDLIECAATAESGARLARLARELDELEHEWLSATLAIDSVDRSRGYYTAMRFHLFAGPDATEIATGGRYDSLYGRFGDDRPAAGFSMNIDALEQLL